MSIFPSFFILAFFTGWVLTKLWIPVVKRLNVVDQPNEDRRLHTTPKPLLGGVPLFATWCVVFLFFAVAVHYGGIKTRLSFLAQEQYVWWLLASGAVLLIGGYIDDKRRLPAHLSIICPIVAVLIAMIGGIGIEKVTNPFGGIFSVVSQTVHIGPFAIPFPAAPITFLWLLGMTYTTKILDGLDGLATGMSAIGFLVVALFTLVTRFYQPNIALIAFILLGGTLGFLWFNFYPAKIFLGEGGSLLLGFTLGVLAIVSGSKIMTTMLVVGVPVVDVAWTILRRLIKRTPVANGDKEHIHHRLLTSGFSHKGAVLFLYVVGALFGISGIFLSATQKLVLLLTLGFFALCFLALAHYATRFETPQKK
jgi:UDP-GlcNAc:undecaprenyl-phosphate GlcNAc-1-phosphate transferase